MNESEEHQMRETGWRRKLTAAEEARMQAHLAARPEAQADWEDDQALTSFVRGLPDAPLASNFTARVMGAVAREQAAQGRAASSRRLWPDWMRAIVPRLAWAAVVALLCVTTLLQYQAAGRKQFTRNLAEGAATLAALPEPEILQDFDAINQLRQASAVSDDAVIEFLR